MVVGQMLGKRKEDEGGKVKKLDGCYRDSTRTHTHTQKKVELWVPSVPRPECEEMHSFLPWLRSGWADDGLRRRGKASVVFLHLFDLLHRQTTSSWRA